MKRRYIQTHLATSLIQLSKKGESRDLAGMMSPGRLDTGWRLKVDQVEEVAAICMNMKTGGQREREKNRFLSMTGTSWLADGDCSETWLVAKHLGSGDNKEWDEPYWGQVSIEVCVIISVMSFWLLGRTLFLRGTFSTVSYCVALISLLLFSNPKDEQLPASIKSMFEITYD